MWKHHMTSPNFGGNFKGICQMVAVQTGSKFMKDHFKRVNLKKKQTLQLNPLIKNFFIERAYKSNNTFGKFPLEVKPTISRGKSRQMEKFNFLAKF